MNKAKNLFRTVAISLALGSIAMGTHQQADAADQIKLKFASPYPVGHPSYNMAKEYIDEIHKLAGDKLKISFFPAEQLGKAKDMLNVCGKGIADICQVHITYFAGQLPYSNVVVVPYWSTATEGSTIYQSMIENSPEIQEEFGKYGVRALEGHTTPSYDVATVSKPVTSLEDLKGLKLKTAGGLFDSIAKRYGIVPVSIPASETYEAVQRGIVDGVVFNYPSIRAYHLNDVVKYITNGMRTGGYPGTTIINNKAWKKLPADVQEAVMTATRSMVAKEGKRWDELHQVVLQEFRDQGIQIHDLTPEQKKEWFKALDGLGEEYIAEIEQRGFKKIRKVYEDYKKTAAKVTGH